MVCFGERDPKKSSGEVEICEVLGGTFATNFELRV